MRHVRPIPAIASSEGGMSPAILRTVCRLRVFVGRGPPPRAEDFHRALKNCLDVFPQRSDECDDRERQAAKEKIR
jgi:hypothetical protein